MKTQKMIALVKVELKKLYRDPMSLAIILLMPVGFTLVFYFAMRDIPTWYLPDTSHCPHQSLKIRLQMQVATCGE